MKEPHPHPLLGKEREQRVPLLAKEGLGEVELT